MIISGHKIKKIRISKKEVSAWIWKDIAFIRKLHVEFEDLFSFSKMQTYLWLIQVSSVKEMWQLKTGLLLESESTREKQKSTWMESISARDLSTAISIWNQLW